MNLRLFLFLYIIVLFGLDGKAQTYCDSSSLKNQTITLNYPQETLTVVHQYSGKYNSKLIYPEFIITLQDTSIISLVKDTARASNVKDSLRIKFILKYKTTNIPVNYNISGEFTWRNLQYDFACRHPFNLKINSSTNKILVKSCKIFK